MAAPISTPSAQPTTAPTTAPQAPRPAAPGLGAPGPSAPEPHGPQLDVDPATNFSNASDLSNGSREPSPAKVLLRGCRLGALGGGAVGGLSMGIPLMGYYLTYNADWALTSAAFWSSLGGWFVQGLMLGGIVGAIIGLFVGSFIALLNLQRIAPYIAAVFSAAAARFVYNDFVRGFFLFEALGADGPPVVGMLIVASLSGCASFGIGVLAVKRWNSKAPA